MSTSSDDDHSDIQPDPLEELQPAIDRFQESHPNGVFDSSPHDSQLLGPISIMGLFLNRTIGSGIFTAPGFVLQGTQSLGGALLLWALGAIFALCALQVWLELSLSVPVHEDQTGQLRNVPRSGGEKNFFEYMFPKPKRLSTCMYGILFITLGNLAGNSISLAIYILTATNHPPSSSGSVLHSNESVAGIAILAITLSVALHIFSRRGGILLNNLFALVKVAFLCVFIVLGFYTRFKGPVDSGLPGLNATTITAIEDSFKPPGSFQTADGKHIQGANLLTSFLYIIYAFSGFIQPFYVLGEVNSPRKSMPRVTMTAMGITIVLYMLVNISYMLVLPAQSIAKGKTAVYLPINFFTAVLGQELGRKVMGSMLVVSIFGNLLVMSFTAGRVKQEIAKEGVLPFYRFFARKKVTTLAWLQNRLQAGGPQANRQRNIRNRLEQAPIPGLILHWITSVFMILVTCYLRPDVEYNVLVTLYAYSAKLLVICFVSGGLLLYKFKKSLNWSQISNYKCLGPVPALITFAVTGATIFAGLAPHTVGVTSGSSKLPYYLLVTISLSSPLWGVLWWIGIEVIQRLRREKLVIIRIPFIVRRRNGEYVQAAEIVDFSWESQLGNSLENGIEKRAKETPRFAESS